MAGLFCVAGCGATGNATRSMANILTSNLQNEALGKAFDDRLNYLTSDSIAFERELSGAGFKLRELSERMPSPCGEFLYGYAPSGEPKAGNGIHASVHFCRENGRVGLRRVGIRRGPMARRD
jgi:hypothetical protein